MHLLKEDMHYVQMNHLCELNLTILYICIALTSLFPNTKSCHRPDTSPSYQHLCMQIPENINFHIVTQNQAFNSTGALHQTA